MELKKRYLGIIGLLILAFILLSLDLGKVIQVLASINLFFFLIAVSLVIVSVFLKGFKYQAIVKAHNKKISLIDSTKYFLIGFFLSLVTPGRIGEIARALYVNQKIGSMGKSISTVVFDRALDLGIIILMGFVATLFFYQAMNIEVVPLWLIIVIALVFGLMVFLVSKRNIVRFLLKPVFETLVPEKFKAKAKTGFENFYISIGEAIKNRKQLAIALISGLVVWSLSGFLMYFYLLSLNIFVPLYFVFLLFPAMAMVEMLPISFSGLGTREATVIFLLGIYGISAAEAVAFSVLVFAVSYAMNAVIGFVLFSRESTKIGI